MELPVARFWKSDELSAGNNTTHSSRLRSFAPRGRRGVWLLLIPAIVSCVAMLLLASKRWRPFLHFDCGLCWELAYGVAIRQLARVILVRLSFGFLPLPSLPVGATEDRLQSQFVPQNGQQHIELYFPKSIAKMVDTKSTINPFMLSPCV